MLLYHFTSRYHWPAIEREGLSKGEAPISNSQWENAVNLTTDSNPEGHGLSKGEPLGPEIIAACIRQHGNAPVNTHWPDKTAIRIKVKIPSSDRSLKRWLTWARKRAEPDYLDRLHKAAGGLGKHRTWWLYFGTISPSRFIAVDFLDEQ